MKDEKLNIFSFLKSVTYSKEDLSNHELFYKEYNIFMINKWLSMSNDSLCISMAMFLSSKNFDKLGHYKFLLNVLPKKYIKFNYQKNNKDYDKEVLKLVGMYYNVGSSKTIEIMRLMNDAQINKIKKSYGGQLNGNEGRKSRAKS